MVLHPRIENFWDALLQPIVDSEGLRCSESFQGKNIHSKAVITRQHVNVIGIPFLVYIT